MAGYSLVELVTVIAITGVVALIPAQVMMDSMRVYASVAPRLDAAYQGRLASERLKRDFRNLGSRGSLTVMQSDAVTFDDLNGDTLAYSLSDDGDLTRNGDLLAQDVSALTLTYRDAAGAETASAALVNLLEVDLTVSIAGQSHRQVEAAYPREPTDAEEELTLFDEAASAASAYEHNDDHFHVELHSLCDDDLEIESFELSSDSAAPDLEEIKLDNKKILKNVTYALPTGERSLNTGSTSDRTIEAGGAPEARIKFDDDFAEGTHTFTLLLNFTDGRSDSLSFSVTR